MKYKHLLIIFTIFFTLHFSFPNDAKAQQGQWTWMNGSSSTDQAGVFGTQGVFAPGNTPPSLYEACEWTDKHGKFWLYGGYGGASDGYYADLWEFDPALNEWAWIKGPGTVDSSAVYGTINVSAMTNNPGARGFGAPSWVDTAGNLWLFGGQGYPAYLTYGYMNDLWRYNITTNEWTWMAGANTANPVGSYGIILVSSATNSPPARSETNASWTNSTDNSLWLFSGEGVSDVQYSDLWRFNIATNQWTWMKGPNTVNQPGVYGTITVPNPANVPGARMAYSKWKDSNGNFWMFGGGDWLNGNCFNDVWEFNPVTNNWTWMNGPNVINTPANYGTQCTPDSSNLPLAVMENRTCWTRHCDNFEFFGGANGADVDSSYNDIWNYSVNSNQWTWMNGSGIANQTGTYGTILVSSATNSPPSRFGCIGWQDTAGNLWMFGGWDLHLNLFYNDMWRFIPDTTCPAIGGSGAVVSAFHSIPDSGCSNANVNFINTSTNGTNFNWSFGDLSSSTSFSPSHTYSDTGTYYVRLIVSSTCSGHSDTMTHTITIFPSLHPVITGDSVFCVGDSSVLFPGSYTAYNWSTGATTQTITVDSANTYAITVTDIHGCTGTASKIVTTIPFLTPTITPSGPTTFCIGDSVTLNPGTYPSYLWNNGTTNMTIIVNSSGTYSVTVTNAQGCTGRASQTIVVNPLPTPHIIGDSVFCMGNNSILNAGNYSHFEWSNNASTQIITVTAANIYIVTVTDANGCTATASKVIVVNPLPTPAITINGRDTICQGDSISINAGIYAFYLWSTNATTNLIYIKTQGTYIVTVTDANGCTNTASNTLTIIPPIQVSSLFTADTLKGCSPLTINFTNNSTNAFTYIWNFGDSASSQNTSTLMNPSHTYNDSGVYTVTLIAVNDTSQCGRFADTSIQVQYIAVANPVIITTKFSGSPIRGCTPLIIDLTNTSINGTSWLWTFGNGDTLNIKDPMQAFYIYAGTYTITLVSFNANARCYNPPDTMTIQVIADSCNLYIPNVFSPNGDGKNDLFNLIAEGFTNYHLLIFDRWGLKVFESTNETTLWNGLVNNTGGQCPDGTYYYIFTAYDYNDAPYSQKGYITLMR